MKNIEIHINNITLKLKKGVSYISNENIYEKGVCQCRKCNNVFDQTKIKHIHREQLGQQSIDRICPYCGSTNFGLMNYPILEKYLIYKSKNFFKKDKNSKNIRHYNISDFINEEDYE